MRALAPEPSRIAPSSVACAYNIVERNTEVSRQLPRVEQREGSRRRAYDLSEPCCCRLSDRLDIAVG